MYFWKSMFPGVHWSWKLQEIIVRREVVVRTIEQMPRMQAGAPAVDPKPSCGWQVQSLTPQPSHPTASHPQWVVFLFFVFGQRGTQKHCISMKILHMKFIPLTIFHKMWSQFLFLFLIMKVKPGSPNFCVMERSKFVALFPFSSPSPLWGTRYPHHIPRAVAPFRNGIAVRLQREGKSFY